jgi:Mg2+ and Co2+ transporter CorA
VWLSNAKRVRACPHLHFAAPGLARQLYELRNVHVVTELLETAIHRATSAAVPGAGRCTHPVGHTACSTVAVFLEFLSNMAPRTRRSPSSDATSTPKTAPTEKAQVTPPANVSAYLYDADGHDREVALTEELVEGLSERQLLWVDIVGHDADQIELLCRTLHLPPDIVRPILTNTSNSHLTKCEDYFHINATALRVNSGEDWKPVPTHFLWGGQLLLTVHPGEVDAFKGFREQDRGETRIGALSAGALTAALLDWHLSAYFRAIEVLERSIDKFDECVLMRATRENLIHDLVRMRHRVSRLRRLLAPQREVFHALTRPDVTQEVGPIAATHFASLSERFERAREGLDHATDLVHGSFALHASRTAESVNAFLKVLTFGTFLLGAMGVVAGLLGMNFQAHFFEEGERGFWSVIGAMLVFTGSALVLARRRRWI